MPFVYILAIIVATYVVQALVAPKADKPKPAGLNEFDLPQTDEGTPQCVFFGDCWTEDWTVVYYGNLRSSPIKSDGEGK